MGFLLPVIHSYALLFSHCSFLQNHFQRLSKMFCFVSCPEILSWLHRVSVKVKADIRESPRHDVIGGIDQHHAEKTVPDSLYILLRLLCVNDDDSENENEQSRHTKLLSIAQNIIFLASGGRRPTPKHIGIGVAVHQATRSKDLVQLLHAAGHSISYESVLRADTTMANEAMKRYFENGEVYIPLNFVNASLPGCMQMTT